MSKPHYRDALGRVGVLSALSPFDPHVAGTPPLALDLADSDIDILCHAPDPVRFVCAIWTAFGEYSDFSVRQWVAGNRPVIAQFSAEGWVFEVFGCVQSVRNQIGWRHFRIEQRLLSLGGATLRTLIMEQRRSGLKTEPAFAAVLNLPGDPYEALLAIETWPDEALNGLLAGVCTTPSWTGL